MADESKSKKASYVGAPAYFKLEMALQQVNAAFPKSYGCFLVGSALDRPDWRDIDVRMILSDEDFHKLFPDAEREPHFFFNPRWLLLTVAISDWLKAQTGLPVDFQFQPQSHANDRHKGRRNAIGLTITKHEADVGDG